MPGPPPVSARRGARGFRRGPDQLQIMPEKDAETLDALRQPASAPWQRRSTGDALGGARTSVDDGQDVVRASR
jgi:hypothetical protein